MHVTHVPFIAVLLVALVACQTVPVTGRSQLVLLPESTELSMGLDAYQQIIKKSTVARDPSQNATVTRVGRRTVLSRR